MRRHRIHPFVLLLPVFVSADAAAAVHTVGPTGTGSGCTHTTIQSAIDAAAASPGADEICIDGASSYHAQHLVIVDADALMLESGYDSCAGDLAAPANSPEFDYRPTPLAGNALPFVSSRQTADDCHPGDTPPPSPVRTSARTLLFFSSSGYPDSQGQDIHMSQVLGDGSDPGDAFVATRERIAGCGAAGADPGRADACPARSTARGRRLARTRRVCAPTTMIFDPSTAEGIGRAP